MARVVIIGATGHIGTFLVPRLIEAGHEVVAISRGQAEPYRKNGLWAFAERLQMDRAALEKDGTFGSRIRDLNGDIVIDMICFTLESAKQLADALAGHVNHFLHVGTIWTHGVSEIVPTSEDAAKRPFGDYGVQKAAIETYLLDKASRDGFPVTLLHPGHIVGPGWVPLNPAGHFNPEVFSAIARGELLTLPNFGMETVHHVHADDIAALFMAAIANRTASVGEAFHAVSDKALTLRGFAQAMFRWFGHEPKLDYLPYEQWAKSQTTEDAQATWEHIARSPNCSMDKSKRILNFTPRYTSLQAVQESVEWLIRHGKVGVCGEGSAVTL